MSRNVKRKGLPLMIFAQCFSAKASVSSSLRLSPHLAFTFSSVVDRHAARRNTYFSSESSPTASRFHLNPSHRIAHSFSLRSLTHNILDVVDEESLLTSTKSQTIKRYRSLSKAKNRAENGVTLLEGHRLIIDTLTNPTVRGLYRDVLVTEEALHHDQLGHTLFNRLVDLKTDGKCRIRLANDAVVRAACDTVNPQGIVAILEIPPSYVPPITPKQKSPLYLILDGVSDPGNVGTLLRSSCAVGVEAVILLPNCCDVWSPKAVRSGMGANFQVPIVKVNDWQDCLKFMTKCDVSSMNIYAATMEGSSDSTAEKESLRSLAYHEVDWLSTGRGSGLCIGKEGEGLSSNVRCDVAKGLIRSVHVPMDGGIESLNAAVCGSVILFEYRRQCQVALQ